MNYGTLAQVNYVSYIRDDSHEEVTVSESLTVVLQ